MLMAFITLVSFQRSDRQETFSAAKGFQDLLHWEIPAVEVMGFIGGGGVSIKNIINRVQ